MRERWNDPVGMKIDLDGRRKLQEPASEEAAN
jgi:hypothetical protein